jgi:endonuclease/exonuclease/phosphatase family metal-dependent hydrolase
MGDLNTAGGPAEMGDPNSQYQRLRNELATARSNWVDLGELMTGDVGTGDPGGGRRIDYIFVSNPHEGARLRPLAAQTQCFSDAKVESLSDHCAVEATLEH